MLFSISMLASLLMASSAFAQSDYASCQRHAESFSGYYGPSPKSHNNGGPLGDIVKGAALGAVLGDNRRATRKGAALGLLFGGIKRSKAQGNEDKKRRDYQFELKACMSG